MIDQINDQLVSTIDGWFKKPIDGLLITDQIK